MSDGLKIFDEAQGTDPAQVAAPKSRPRWPGGLAGGIAILMVFSWAAGLALLSAGSFEFGMGLTISAILLSAIAIVAGLIAAIGSFGRGWGIAAIVVGVLLNPVLVLLLLSWLGAL